MIFLHWWPNLVSKLISLYEQHVPNLTKQIKPFEAINKKAMVFPTTSHNLMIKYNTILIQSYTLHTWLQDEVTWRLLCEIVVNILVYMHHYMAFYHL